MWVPGPPDAPALHGVRASSTGMGEARSTASALLPSIARFTPRRPCVPITIKSAGQFWAAVKIRSATGNPRSS
ncbi:hypothetical protein G6F63_016377 [Rhizopus arrhizus]|nr:hypothetical protein G6F63_016377 [Rhizopus arrhizus]